MRILDRINRTGTTVLMATHDHAIVDAMRRRVVQLERGRVVRDQSRGRYESFRSDEDEPQAKKAAPPVEQPSVQPPPASEDLEPAAVPEPEPST